MGLYFNPDDTLLSEMLNTKVFVDKSEFIGLLNSNLGTENRNMCISRPRRFGKTMAAVMAAAYYSCGCNSRQLFEGLKISQQPNWDVYLNKYNVLRLDIQGFYDKGLGERDVVDLLTEALKAEMQEEFPEITFDNDMTLSQAMQKVFSKTKRGFVVIMDEYDVLIRTQVSQSVFSHYLLFLNDLFKSIEMRQVIKLAYITGILPIVKERMQSKLNNFTEYSMLKPGDMAEYIGFTRNEVEKLCREHNMSIDECLYWYDGYQIKNKVDISAPYSVVSAMRSHQYSSHWTKTSSFECLRDYINMDFDGIQADVCKLMAGQSIVICTEGYNNTLTNFETKDDIFTYLIHLGYLSYNADSQMVQIPNREVMLEWKLSVDRSNKYMFIGKMIEESRDLLNATKQAVRDTNPQNLTHVKSENKNK